MDVLQLLDTRRGKPGDPGALRDVLRGAALDGRTPRIRCPLCRWHPDPSSRWACKCLTVWNTFQTGGMCPGCGHRWSHTMCLACHRWSRHEDWYQREGDPGPAA